MFAESLLCMSMAVFFESRSEPLNGQFAVAEVVLRRKRDKRWPDGVCAVVFQPSQFEFTDLPLYVLQEQPKKEPAAWDLAFGVAIAARLSPDGRGSATRCADHFHGEDPKDGSPWPPKWTSWMLLEKKIGGHYFYCSTDI